MQRQAISARPGWDGVRLRAGALAASARGCLQDRWVRFHGLPGSKRYADSGDDYAELVRRHLTVLGELLSRDGTGEERGLLVFTAVCSAVTSSVSAAGLRGCLYPR